MDLDGYIELYVTNISETDFVVKDRESDIIEFFEINAFK